MIGYDDDVDALQNALLLELIEQGNDGIVHGDEGVVRLKYF